MSEINSHVLMSPVIHFLSGTSKYIYSQLLSFLPRMTEKREEKMKLFEKSFPPPPPTYSDDVVSSKYDKIFVIYQIFKWVKYF